MRYWYNLISTVVTRHWLSELSSMSLKKFQRRSIYEHHQHSKHEVRQLVWISAETRTYILDCVPNKLYVQSTLMYRQVTRQVDHMVSIYTDENILLLQYAIVHVACSNDELHPLPVIWYTPSLCFNIHILSFRTQNDVAVWFSSCEHLSSVIWSTYNPN